MTTTDIEIDYDPRYFRHATRDTVSLYAHRLRVDPAAIPSNKHLIVRAYEVETSGTLAIPGKMIAIYCRILRCAEGSTLDVSGGAPSAKAPPPRPAESAGAHGTSGESGKAGADAGLVTIVAERLEGRIRILASGGAGQDGQDGGAGAQGGVGAAGADGTLGSCPCTDGRPGGSGGQGGSGGRGGDGGSGGSAGLVRLVFATRPEPTQLEVRAEGGGAGRGGEPGVPGNGGRGGAGGLHIREHRYSL